MLQKLIKWSYLGVIKQKIIIRNPHKVRLTGPHSYLACDKAFVVCLEPIANGRSIQLALFDYSPIIITLMKGTIEVNEQQFHQKLQLHSMTTILNQSEPVPLYKLGIRPYDYYIQYAFKGDLARLHFYQELESTSTLIVAPEYISTSEIEQSYLDRWFGLSEKSRFSITCFLKYYNYTIHNWIDQQKGLRSVISEQEILMVLRQLLTFHKIYQQYYRQSCGIFRAELIYITPEKCLRIYPQSIKYTGQILINKQQLNYLNSSTIKLDKQVSVETTISNSQAQIQITNDTESDEINLNSDLKDIFILALQLISFKRYDHFYSQKHQMIIWDAVNSLLNSIHVSHLSPQFITLLKECASLKIFDSYWLLMEVDKLIFSKQKMCKTIHVEKNQQLAQLKLKKMQTQKSKKLEDLKLLTKNDHQGRLTRNFQSF